MDCKSEVENGQLISTIFGPKYMSTKLFQDFPQADLLLALTLIIRPLPGSTTPEPLENYGSVRRIYVVLGDDQRINRPVEDFKLENYPPEEVKLIDGANHMAMLSKPLKELKGFPYQLTCVLVCSQ